MGEFETIIASHFRDLIEKLNANKITKDDVVYIGREDNYVIAIYYK